MSEEQQQASRWKAVYTIVERGSGKKLWLRIGTAFVNRDASLNVVLDAVPINGKLHIRDATPAAGPGLAQPPAEKPFFREEEMGGGDADDDIPF